MPQIRDVVAFDVPIEIKLSEILVELEKLGDITRIGVDEKKRKSGTVMNVFASFAESASALRAIKACFITLNGIKIDIKANRDNMKKHQKDTPRIKSPYNKFKRRRTASSDQESESGRKRSEIHSRLGTRD